MTVQPRPKGVWGTLAFLVSDPWNIIISVAVAGLIVLGIYAYGYAFK
jgi:hypothetical protein